MTTPSFSNSVPLGPFSLPSGWSATGAAGLAVTHGEPRRSGDALASGLWGVCQRSQRPARELISRGWGAVAPDGVVTAWEPYRALGATSWVPSSWKHPAATNPIRSSLVDAAKHSVPGHYARWDVPHIRCSNWGSPRQPRTHWSPSVTVSPKTPTPGQQSSHELRESGGSL